MAESRVFELTKLCVATTIECRKLSDKNSNIPGENESESGEADSIILKPEYVSLTICESTCRRFPQSSTKQQCLAAIEMRRYFCDTPLCLRASLYSRCAAAVCDMPIRRSDRRTLRPVSAALFPRTRRAVRCRVRVTWLPMQTRS